MSRHPAKDLIDATIVDTDGDMSGTEEQRMFADFAQDAKQADKTPTFSVFYLRTDPKTSKPSSSTQGSFCFEAPMDTYATYSEILSYIRDNYGSGHYRITGRMLVNSIEKVGFNKIVHILEPRPKASTNPAPQADNQLVAILQEMRRSSAEQNARFDSLLQRMMEARAESNRPGFDVNMLVSVATAASSILASMKGLFAPPTTQNNLLETLALIKGVKNITDEISDDRGGGDSDAMTEAIRTFGKPLAMAMMMQAQKNGASQPSLNSPQVSAIPRPAPSAPVQPVVSAPAVTPTVSPGVSMDAMTEAFKGRIRQLLMFARGGMKPSSVVVLVLDNITDEDLSHLMQILEDDQVIVKVMQLVPEAVPYQQWLQEFRQEMFAQTHVDDEETDDDDSPAAPGDSSDVSEN